MVERGARWREREARAKPRRCVLVSLVHWAVRLPRGGGGNGKEGGPPIAANAFWDYSVTDRWWGRPGPVKRALATREEDA